MKSITLLCLLTASFATHAQTASQDVSGEVAAGAEAPIEAAQAIVDFELLETKGKRTTLLTSGAILADIGTKATAKQVPKNFADGFDNKTPGIVVVREQTYVQHSTTTTKFDKDGKITKEKEETPGVMPEGVRAQVMLVEPVGKALEGKLYVDLRKIEKMSNITHDGHSIQLPKVKATSFEVPLKEGQSSQQFGEFTIKTKVNKTPQK